MPPCRLLALLLLAACSGPELLNALSRNPDAATTVLRDVAYGDGERQRLDLYVPAEAEADSRAFPILMFVHGGSWTAGRKEDYAFAGQRFAAAGYVTGVPSYRLLPEGVYPVFMRDTAAALARTIERGAGVGGDPERVFLVGHSAGAYNVVQLALAPEFLAKEGLTPATIDAVAGLSGPYDFLPLDSALTRRVFGAAADLAATQPVARVTPDAPPMILVTGDADEVVDPANTRALAAALEEVGVPVRAISYEGGDHAAPLVAIGLPRRGTVLDDVTAFFDAHGAADPGTMREGDEG